MGARERLKRVGILLGGTLAVPLFLWAVYTGLTWDLRGGGEDPDPHFHPVPVARGDLVEAVVATGRLEPLARVVLQSEIPGIVAAVHVDDGERVTRGQPLVELDRDRIEHLVAELRAALDVQRARARQDLAGHAAAELEEARRDLDRVERLFAAGVASERALDDARHRAKLAEIALSDAGAESAARRAAVVQAREALRRREKDLEKSVIRSPVDGVVVERRVEVGTAVADIENGGTVIAVLADDGRLHVLAQVDENDIAGVRVGQPASVHIDAFPGETFAGRVRKVSAAGAGDERLSSFDVEIEIEGDERVRVGMSADARIAVREHHQVLLVPNTAVVRQGDGAYLRVASGERNGFALVRIGEGYSDGFQTVVTAGVSAGDRVWVRSDGEE